MIIYYLQILIGVKTKDMPVRIINIVPPLVSDFRPPYNIDYR